MIKSKQKKILAYKCARCFTENADKLAWFYGSNSIFMLIAYFVIHVLKRSIFSINN
jgi:hypothetical protein